MFYEHTYKAIEEANDIDILIWLEGFIMASRDKLNLIETCLLYQAIFNKLRKLNMG